MLKKYMLVYTLFITLFSFTGCSDQIEFYVVDSEYNNEDNLIISNDSDVDVDSDIDININIITKTSIDTDEIDEVVDVDIVDEIEDIEEIIDEVSTVDIVDTIETIVETTNTAPLILTGSNLVASSTAVSNEYLSDALFIGDSLLKGFKAFVSPYPNNVIADQNAGLDQIYANKSIYYTSPSVQTSLWNAIEEVMPNPEKVYVLIGANGVPGLENEQSMWYYEDLIVKLKNKFPGKVMYFCALTPLTQELSDQRSPSFCTDKLNDFNSQLLSLCQTQDVYFLQADEWLKDENGYLLPDYDGGDGMHLNKAGHSVLLEYFKTHTISLDVENLDDVDEDLEILEDSLV